MAKSDRERRGAVRETQADIISGKFIKCFDFCIYIHMYGCVSKCVCVFVSVLFYGKQ